MFRLIAITTYYDMMQITVWRKPKSLVLSAFNGDVDL